MLNMERFHWVPGGYDVDMNTGGDNLATSINMSNYQHATFIIQYWDLGGADHRLYVYSGASVGALTSEVPFTYCHSTVASVKGDTGAQTATADVMTASTKTTVATPYLTVANATYDYFLFIVDVDAEDMDLANNEKWLTLDFNDPGGATGRATVVVMLTPRYAAECSATAIS